ncbi:CCA tRNA nucleotidyltransferase [Lachnoclostridium phytofermentans]|uniref:Polynucleotide adenylyltransferase/metal dependent phosphohydrolase n=1 Tax=Lachnoclostridium phytofermentans (strain ATCC 700394 / DSM 18823 / ISDg) TaxID=357809 RepID=A9KL25_LACP7|nr:CCA tRNA nucleotidyltransferase [Lachnoclostridium phytofermentans]ABX44174.1 polynucleotide adenylyltransferase/metal dependent phosphohydrolase [Lachnoclostridium phytofermentans ISDg]
MIITLPDKVNYIIEELMSHGFEGYAVGGCVRDSLLGRIPGDWDITTSANPCEVKQIFSRTIDTGIKHGTVTVMLGKEGFEVTTYRLDGEYEDNRHPKQVEYTKNLIEDLKRRDFTINAMAYNAKDGLVDEFEGLKDLQDKKIRCVGSADQRFDEDALRILRAVRFSAQLNFTIEDETLAAIRLKALNLKNISAERIREELNKLLLSSHPKKIMIAYETGLTEVILPEFDQMLATKLQGPYQQSSVGEHTLEALRYFTKNLSKDVEDKKQQLIYCWAILLHDVAKPVIKDNNPQVLNQEHQTKGANIAKSILRRLKFDNETIESVTKLVYYHNFTFGHSKEDIRRATNQIGEKYMPMLFVLQECNMQTKDSQVIEEMEKDLKRAKELYQDMIEHGECVSLKSLAVNGKDLMDQGFESGKNIGVLLDMLLEKVIIDPSLNTKDQLLKIATSQFQNKTDGNS